MGNEYKITTEAKIVCECGGEVKLNSSSPNEKIGEAKPVLYNDILNAPISCPRSKDPCTKVVCINSSGTIIDEFGGAKTYLYNTDGFSTDKSRKVILKDPGQSTNKGSGTVSKENEKSHYVKIVEDKDERLEEYECKYRLYLLRQSSTLNSYKEKEEVVYKPIRVSRDFIKSEDVFNKTANPTINYYDFDDEQKYDNVYSQMLSFVYILQDDELKGSYQIFSRGAINNYQLEDVRYTKLDTQNSSRYIPLYQMSDNKEEKYSIYYSNIKLENIDDIKRLPKLQIDTKRLIANKSTYVKDIESLNKDGLNIIIKRDNLPNIQIPKEELSYYNIVGVIEDSIGEIDDLYDEYYANYKLIHSKNKDVIDSIKDKNQYVYTVTSLIDYYYVPKEKQNRNNKDVEELANTFKELANILLKTKSYKEYIINKSKSQNEETPNLIECLNKDNEKAIALLNEVLFVNKDFFDNLYRQTQNISYYSGVSSSSLERITNGYFLVDNYIYKSNSYNPSYISHYSTLHFNSQTNNYKKFEDKPAYVLALLVFSILFFPSKEVEDLNISADVLEEVKTLRWRFLSQLVKIEPLPQIKQRNIEDIRDLLDKQELYKSLVSKDNNYIEEFEQLDYQLNIFAFTKEPNIFLKFLNNIKRIKTNHIYIPQDLKLTNDKFTKPQTILEQIAKKLKDKKLTELLTLYKSFEDVDKFEYVLCAMNISILLHNIRIHLDEELNLSSFFLEGHKSSKEFIEDTIKRRTLLSLEIKEDLYNNYEVNQVFNEMLCKIISHKYVKDSSNKNLESFLDIANDTTYEKRFYTQDFTKDEERIYKFFTLINDINSQIEDRKDFSNKNSNKKVEGTVITQSTKGTDGTQSTQSTQSTDGTEGTKTNLNASLQTLSFVMSIINLKRLIAGEEKLNVKSVVGTVSDMSNIAAFTTAMLLNKERLTINRFKTDFFEKNKNIFKKINLFSIKLSNRLILPLIIINGISDSVEFYKSDDIKAANFTLVKMGIIAIGFLVRMSLGVFSIAVIILEILSYFIMDLLVDTKLEKYIKNSLLFLTKGGLNIFKDYKFEVNILAQSIPKDSPLKATVENGFSDFKSIVNFIGSNYDEHKTLFDTALLNELNIFKSSFIDFKVERVDKFDKAFVFDNSNYHFNYSLGLKVQISSENNIMFYISSEEFIDDFQSIDYKKQINNEYYFDLFDTLDDKILKHFNINPRSVTNVRSLRTQKMKYEDFIFYFYIVQNDIIIKHKITVVHFSIDRENINPIINNINIKSIEEDLILNDDEHYILK